MASPVINRGTGAGGAGTNASGKPFEERTENETRLLANGFVRKTIPHAKKSKFGYYLEKIIDEDRSIVYVTQGGWKLYCEHFLGKETFRHPDEAYIFKQGGTYKVKILEKKAQNVEGSVDTKLCVGQYFVDEYKMCLGEEVDVEYAFCLSSFLKRHYLSEDKKWVVMRALHQKQKIRVFFGEDEDYYTQLDAWLYS